jgi:hypothetical protein
LEYGPGKHKIHSGITYVWCIFMLCLSSAMLRAKTDLRQPNVLKFTEDRDQT